MRSVFALSLLAASSTAFALEPANIWIVVNKNVPESRQVANHYIAKRGVPKDQVIELDLPKGEDISRADYDTKVVPPIRVALQEKKDAAKVLLTTYGVPLRVGGTPPNAEEQKELNLIRPDLNMARKELSELEKKDREMKILDPARAEVYRRIVNRLQFRERSLSHPESQACMDSELMLLWWPKYRFTGFAWPTLIPMERWVANPLNFQASDTYRKSRPPVMMTSRLDGPSVEIALRLIDDAIAVEAKGLVGDVVIDSRGIPLNPKTDPSGTGYGGYDESMREAAKLLETAGMKVTLDTKDAVLPPGSAKNVAIYCGWYSHANFVDCCEYVQGAVAWHLASSEAVTLRNKDSKVWCPNLLKKGVCATLGPVGEPYTVGFPKPAEFFGFLATGEYTLVEAYSRTVLMCSWMTVLVGDPLYNPFKKNAKLKSVDVLPSPKRPTP
ncbi:MAG: TIGR03790 family protein [Planctomycetes bacterium]|nr:TIGR03790 family protein [Planctomycetota bacterium]